MNNEAVVLRAIMQVLEQRVAHAIEKNYNFFFRNVSVADLDDAIPELNYLQIKQICKDLTAQGKLIYANPGYRIFDYGTIASYATQPCTVPYRSYIFGHINTSSLQKNALK